jgi:uncharacterized protein (TIGR03437 family)
VSFNSAIRCFVVFLLFAALLPAQSGVPVLPSGGVTNAADYSRDLAPGMIITVWGTNLAPKVAAATAVPLPTTLEGTSVEVIDGSRTLNAPLFYVSPGQINAQLPFDLTGATVKVRVKNAAGASGTETVTVLPRAPRLFTKTMDGKGEAIALHANFTPVSAASPASPGEVLILFLTGLGAVDPSLAAGAPGGDGSAAKPLNLVTTAISVMVGGQAAKVQFAGLAPYFVGLYQVNFQVPAEILNTGAQALTVSTAGRDSQGNVTLACKSNWQALGSSTIDSGGGTVQAGGFTVSARTFVVPSPTTVTVLQRNGALGSLLDEDLASDVFALSGLPATTGNRMTVRLAMKRPVSGGVFVHVSNLAAPVAGATLLAPTIEGNELVVTIPAVSAAASSQLLPAALKPVADAQPAGIVPMFAAIAGFQNMMSDSGKFVLYYRPKAIQYAQVQQIAAALDDANSKLQQRVGLNWPARSWPMRVFLYPFFGKAAQRWGEEGDMDAGIQEQGLSLNTARIVTDADLETMKLTAGHELFHVMQNLYSVQPRGANAWLWLLEAASTWFERMLSTDPNYVAQTTQDNIANNPFLFNEGLEYPPGDAGLVQDHGYGAAAFLQTFSDRHGEKSVGDVIRRMSDYTGLVFRSFAYSPVQALQLVGSDVGADWREFCRRLTTSTVYPLKAPISWPGAGGFKVFFNRSFTPSISGPVTADWNAPDLSAWPFAVELDASWPAATKLTLSISGPSEAELIVYKRRFPELTLVGTGGVVQFDKAEEAAKNGYKLVAMIVNGHAYAPYNTTSPIRLTITLDNIFAHLVTTKFAKISISSPTLEGLKSSVYLPDNARDFGVSCPLKWSKTSFSFDCSTTDSKIAGTVTVTSSVAGTLSPDGSQVLTLSGNRVYTATYTNGLPTTVESSSFSVKNLGGPYWWTANGYADDVYYGATGAPLDVVDFQVNGKSVMPLANPTGRVYLLH